MRNYSRQRELVLDILKKSYSHPTAEEVFIEARKVDGNISLGTVYRNLEILCLDGIVEKISTPASKDRYDFKKSKHSHAICEKCGKITDIEVNLDIDKLKKDIKNKYSFNVTQDEIRIIGICKECNKN